MPIIKSAIKRARQTTKRTVRNQASKRQLKAATKSLESALANKQTAKLADLLQDVQSALDTAVKKNLMHRNRAARLLSNYTAKVKAAGAKTKKSAPKTKPASKAKATKKPAAKKSSKTTKK